MSRLRRDTSCVLNRCAVVVRPAQPFIDWLHKADPTSSDLALADLRVEPNIYLLPKTGSPDETDRLLRRCFDTIFSEELDAWYRDRSTWPPKRTYQMFRLWFECTDHSLLFDLADTDLSYYE